MIFSLFPLSFLCYHIFLPLLSFFCSILPSLFSLPPTLHVHSSRILLPVCPISSLPLCASRSLPPSVLYPSSLSVFCPFLPPSLPLCSLSLPLPLCSLSLPPPSLFSIPPPPSLFSIPPPPSLFSIPPPPSLFSIPPPPSLFSIPPPPSLFSIPPPPSLFSIPPPPSLFSIPPPSSLFSVPSPSLPLSIPPPSLCSSDFYFDSRLRCATMQLYGSMFGRLTPSCVPQGVSITKALIAKRQILISVLS